MGSVLELGPRTSVVPFYLKASQMIFTWYFTAHLKARSLHVGSIVISVFRQKSRVLSSVWGREGLCSLWLQVEGYGSFIRAVFLNNAAAYTRITWRTCASTDC